MTVRLVDYSWHRPGGAAIKAAGFAGAIRYIDYPGAGGKGLTADELADLRANGLAVVLVFESTAGRAKDGYNAGVIDGHTAGAELAALEFPVDRPIYFAVDFDAQPTEYAAIDRYLAGVESVIGLARVGVYGSYAVIEHCAAVDAAQWFWQTYAWSGERKFDGNHIYQYRNGQELNGGAVDYNEAYGDDYGQWPAEERGLSMDDKALLQAIYAALTGGEAKVLEEWNAKGNSLLLGYAQEQALRGETGTTLIEHIQNHAAGVTGPVQEHTHEGGKVRRP